jgi:acetoin utilization deacetylase AcuC-like enzyme
VRFEPGQNAWLNIDTTAVSPGSVEAAEVSAGAAIAALEAVVQGRAPGCERGLILD